MSRLYFVNLFLIILIEAGLLASALRLDAVSSRATRVRSYFTRQMAATPEPLCMEFEEDGDKEWMESLRNHRKGGAPRKVVEDVQERLEEDMISQSMLVKAFRTLERMNRDDLAMQLVPMWPKIATKYGVNFGSAFVLVNACCKRRDLLMASEICRISGLIVDNNMVDYVSEKINIEQATSFLVELIVGYQANKEYGEALSLLTNMQQSEREWTLSEDDSRRIMKHFLKGTARSTVIRGALRSILLLGGLKDKQGLQLLTNTYATSIRFIKGAVSMDTLPVVVNTEAYAENGGMDGERVTGGTEYVEVAFIGRSNVGKSSLINMMTNRKGLAFTSKTPGKTAEFNYFELRSRYNDLVDTWGRRGIAPGGGSAEARSSPSDAFGGKYSAKKNDWNNNGPSSSHGGHVPSSSSSGKMPGGPAGKKKTRGSAGRRATTRRREKDVTGMEEEETKKRAEAVRQLSQEAVTESDKRVFFVDLPGLGYAERTRVLKERWLGLLGEYISGRSGLRVLLHLVDSRHGLLDVDKECLMSLETLPAHVTYVIVLTKVDKSKDATVTAIIEKVRREVDAKCTNEGQKERQRQVPIICTSSEQGFGGARLWTVILDAINGLPAEEIMDLTQHSATQ